jgi:hypothetical protein
LERKIKDDKLNQTIKGRIKLKIKKEGAHFSTPNSANKRNI